LDVYIQTLAQNFIIMGRMPRSEMKRSGIELAQLIRKRSERSMKRSGIELA